MSAVNNNGAIVEFNEGNATDSFNFKGILRSIFCVDINAHSDKE